MPEDTAPIAPTPASTEVRLPSPLRAPNQASALEEVQERADTVWVSGRPAKVQTTERRDLRGPRGRIAFIDGCRTPFIKSGTDFLNMDVVDLASIPAAELVTRLALDPEEIGLSVF